MKVHDVVVIDIATGKVEYDEWYEYNGLVSECKGGSGGSSKSKPLKLDSWMKEGPYSWLQDYFGEVNETYNPMDQLTQYLSTQEGNEAALQGELTGDQGAIAQQKALLNNMASPDMVKASMQPYLSQAYDNIGSSGTASSSYADKLIGSATTRGWMDNWNNLMGGWNNVTGQTTDLTNALNQNAQNVYDMTTEPLQFIKDIQKLRYGSSVSKSSSGGGKSGFSLGF